LASAADTSAACGPFGSPVSPLLQEAVARSAAAGRVPPSPVGPGELAAEPVADDEGAAGTILRISECAMVA
jgi:hypothetical protein